MECPHCADWARQLGLYKWPPTVVVDGWAGDEETCRAEHGRERAALRAEEARQRAAQEAAVEASEAAVEAAAEQPCRGCGGPWQFGSMTITCHKCMWRR